MRPLHAVLQPLITPVVDARGSDPATVYVEGHAFAGNTGVVAPDSPTRIAIHPYAFQVQAAGKLRIAADIWAEDIRRLLDADALRAPFRRLQADDAISNAECRPALAPLRRALESAFWGRFQNWPATDAIVLRAGFALTSSRPPTWILARSGAGTLKNLDDDPHAQAAQEAISGALSDAWLVLKPLLDGLGMMTAGWTIPRPSAHERMQSARAAAGLM